MKSCDGCRHKFIGWIGPEEKQFCRAHPPTPQVRVTSKGVSMDGWYPLIPAIRCGAYSRRWFGKTPALPRPIVRAPVAVETPPAPMQPAVQQPPDPNAPPF
jgi:hypothetical protein